MYRLVLALIVQIAALYFMAFRPLPLYSTFVSGEADVGDVCFAGVFSLYSEFSPRLTGYAGSASLLTAPKDPREALSHPELPSLVLTYYNYVSRVVSVTRVRTSWSSSYSEFDRRILEASGAAMTVGIVTAVLGCVSILACIILSLLAVRSRVSDSSSASVPVSTPDKQSVPTGPAAPSSSGIVAPPLIMAYSLAPISVGVTALLVVCRMTATTYNGQSFTILLSISIAHALVMTWIEIPNIQALCNRVLQNASVSATTGVSPAATGGSAGGGGGGGLSIEKIKSFAESFVKKLKAN